MVENQTHIIQVHFHHFQQGWSDVAILKELDVPVVLLEVSFEKNIALIREVEDEKIIEAI